MIPFTDQILSKSPVTMSIMQCCVLLLYLIIFTTILYISVAGVPYIVSVIAENTAGNSSESCHMIGFSDQQSTW